MKTYLDMRRSATILRDEGDYNLAACEMNPVIFEEFVGIVLESQLPPVIWEPFAGHMPRSRNYDFADEVGITLLAQTLNPKDSRIKAADSMVTGPDRAIGGVLFHPPYFGASTSDKRDVANAVAQERYMRNLQAVATRADTRMARNGLACVVGRDYRARGMRVRLDKWLLEMFEDRRYVLEDVWSSEPDIVLILRRTI